jgi:hypothetical protein
VRATFHATMHYRPDLTEDARPLLEAVAYRRVAAQAEAGELEALARYAAAQPDPQDRYLPMEIAGIPPNRRAQNQCRAARRRPDRLPRWARGAAPIARAQPKHRNHPRRSS